MGAKFASFSELKEAVVVLEEETNSSWRIFRSDKLAETDDALREQFVYKRATFTCTYLGQPNPRGEGMENGTSSAAGKLEVREASASLEHTHDADPEEHTRLYCKRRCLSMEEKEEAKKLLKMNMKPTEVRKMLAESTGKSILTYKIHWIWIASMVDKLEHDGDQTDAENLRAKVTEFMEWKTTRKRGLC